MEDGRWKMEIVDVGVKSKVPLGERDVKEAKQLYICVKEMTPPSLSLYSRYQELAGQVHCARRY